jgi:hypothetical protein
VAFGRKARKTILAKLNSALTAAELGEMLPIVRGYCPVCSKHPTKWQCGYLGNEGRTDHMPVVLGEHQESATEADSLAKMLIYLFENGLVDDPTQPIP